MSPAIAKLPGPDTELVAGIDGGEGVAAGQGLVTRKELGKVRAGQLGRVETDQSGDLGAGRHKVGARQGLGGQAGVKTRRDAREGVVEGQGFEGVHDGPVVGLAWLWVGQFACQG